MTNDFPPGTPLIRRTTEERLAYYSGLRQGIRLYAWYVGTNGQTLKEALAYINKMEEASMNEEAGP